MGVANSVFTWLFAGELVIKLAALGFVEYVSEGWNVFDALVVLISLLEVALGSIGGNLSGLR